MFGTRPTPCMQLLQVSTTRYSELQIWPPFEKRDGGLITKKLECPLLCKTSLRITGGINEVEKIR